MVRVPSGVGVASVPTHSKGTRLDLVEGIAGALDLVEDSVGGGGPDEGLGSLILFGEVVIDGGFEFGDALEGAAADGIARDFGE